MLHGSESRAANTGHRDASLQRSEGPHPLRHRARWPAQAALIGRYVSVAVGRGSPPRCSCSRSRSLFANCFVLATGRYCSTPYRDRSEQELATFAPRAHPAEIQVRQPFPGISSSYGPIGTRVYYASYLSTMARQLSDATVQGAHPFIRYRQQGISLPIRLGGQLSA